MDKKEKLEILKKLDEKQLRKEVLIPLFEKMGFRDVIEYHGTIEKGKDIIFNEKDVFGEKVFTGVVVKKGDITGSASSGGAMVVLNQIEQTFDEAYTDKYSLKEPIIDRCIVVTSGCIRQHAIESIKGRIKRTNLDKLVKFFDGSKLVDLLDDYWPEYFFKQFKGFTAYFNAMKNDFETIQDISAIGQREGIPLEKIYVSLKLSEKRQERDTHFDKEMKIFDGVEMEKEMKRKAENILRKERVMNIETAVKNFHRLVVVGAPGAGKTTLLKYLALKYGKENIEKKEKITVPIPITLREFIQDGNNKSLKDYINDVFDRYCFPNAKEFIEKDLKSGKCILLLDGFDELATREKQDRISKEIRHFVEKFRRCRVVVTSRQEGYYDELAGFTRLELMELDDQQVKKFIKNWFGEKESKKAASMFRVVKENKNISAMARNPLMISIIAIIYEEDMELPQRRAELYQRAVDVLLSKWDKRKKIKNKYTGKKKEFILRKMAFENHCRNRRNMAEETLIDLIHLYASQLEMEKHDAIPLIMEICQRSSILRQIAQGMYDFLHLAFQEYFTALELKIQEDGISTIIRILSKPWWEEPILLYAGISTDAAPLIKRIQTEVPEDIFYSNLMLAGKCIADAEFTEPELKDEITKKIWHLYQEGEFLLLRKKAIKILSLMKPRNIIESLNEQLRHRNQDIRADAAKALGAIGSTWALPALMETLKADENRNVQKCAAESIGAIGSIETFPVLKEILKIEKNGEVRAGIVEALGVIGGTEALPILIERVKKDEERVVRKRAVETLGVIGSTRVLPMLIKCLETDPDHEVRERAAQALGEIGSVKAIPILLKTLKSNEDDSIRGLAAIALGAIGREKEIPVLIETLETAKSEKVRGSAAEALGLVGSVKAIPKLKNALKNDKERSVRGYAASALGAIGRAEAIPLLTKTIKTDEEAYARGHAASALGNIGSAEEIPVLIQTLETDESEYVRGSAAEALGKIGDETAFEPLKKALRDESEGIFFIGKVKDKAFESLYNISRRLGVRIPQQTMNS